MHNQMVDHFSRLLAVSKLVWMWFELCKIWDINLIFLKSSCLIFYGISQGWGSLHGNFCPRVKKLTNIWRRNVKHHGYAQSTPWGKPLTAALQRNSKPLTMHIITATKNILKAAIVPTSNNVLSPLCFQTWDSWD